MVQRQRSGALGRGAIICQGQAGIEVPSPRSEWLDGDGEGFRSQGPVGGASCGAGVGCRSVLGVGRVPRGDQSQESKLGFPMGVRIQSHRSVSSGDWSVGQGRC